MIAFVDALHLEEEDLPLPPREGRLHGEKEHLSLLEEVSFQRRGSILQKEITLPPAEQHIPLLPEVGHGPGPVPGPGPGPGPATATAAAATATTAEKRTSQLEEDLLLHASGKRR